MMHKKIVLEENLEFGMSVLHERVRLLESILHLSYRTPIQKWPAVGVSEKKNREGDERESVLLVSHGSDTP